MTAIVADSATRRRIAGREQVSPVDPWLTGAVIALLALGAIMVYSASVAVAERTLGNSTYYISRHLVHLSLGLVLMVLMRFSSSRLWAALGPWLLVGGLVSLVLVLFPGVGVTANGSSRWINLGVARLQPSEFMKLFLVIYVAGYLVRKQDQLRLFVPGILMIGLVVATAGVLVLQQPDLGSVAVMCATVMGMMFLAGVRFWHFLLVMGAGAGGMALLTLISPYRMERVTGFLDPWADPFDAGFQLVQALIAFGRGEWFGVGLGASIQKLSYLPAAHTDFLLAVLAEELGLLGVLTVITLFGIVIYRSLMIAQAAEKCGALYAARLAQGLGLWLGIQALINIGVNMGVLPTKGLTLPLMSYGGSSLLASCMAVGLLLMVEKEVRAQSWR